MPKLPSISARELIRALERLGFAQISQSGSHVKMRRALVTCIVPLHREMRKGTIAGVLRQANTTVEDLQRALLQ